MARPENDFGTGDAAAATAARYRREDCGPAGTRLNIVLDDLRPGERIVSVYPTKICKPLWTGYDMNVNLEALIDLGEAT